MFYNDKIIVFNGINISKFFLCFQCINLSLSIIFIACICMDYMLVASDRTSAAP